MIKAIIFDFDGVILESAQIKTEAFSYLVRDLPEKQQKQFVEYHRKNMGISRYTKFQYLVEEILHKTYSKEEEQRYSSSFNQIVMEQIIKCPFVPGAEEFLKRNHKKLQLFIASGTPIEELNLILEKRNLKDYFTEAYGTPMKKDQITEQIQNKYHLFASEIIFVGDAIVDKETAEKEKLIFIGRRTPDNIEDFLNVEYLINNLLEIEDIIKRVNTITS